MVPFIKEQIKLSRIIEKIIGASFNQRASMNETCRRHTLNSLNIELCAWKEQLPPWADFRKWDPITQPLKPSLAALQYGTFPINVLLDELTERTSVLYHSARIALNFDNGISIATAGVGQPSRDLCLSSSEETIAITRRLSHQYGLRHSPIVLVYGVTQAIRVVTSSETLESTHPLPAALTECSATWGLAQQMKARIFPDSPGTE